MSLYSGLSIISTNLGMQISLIIFIVSIIGAIVFFTSDYRLGLIYALLIGSLNFMLAYKLVEDYTYALIFTVMCVVLLSLSILSTAKQTTTSGFL